MKKLVFALMLLAVISPVFAQTHDTTVVNADTNMYYLNVPVEKIYPSSEGYIVFYRKFSNDLGTVGIPNEWVHDAAGRAEIIRLPRGPNWPSMSVFYRGGEFSHVRLYVHSVKGHRTWGAIPQGTNVSRFFEDREAFNIEY